MAIDRPRGILSPADRKYLKNPDEYSPQAAHERERSIVERVGAGFRDFRLLTDELPDDLRDEIFGPEPRTAEYRELEGDIQAAIAFMYAGLGGESAFRQPLQYGVSNGENALDDRNVTAFDVKVQFAVKVLSHVDVTHAAELIKSGDWDRVDEVEILAFARSAARAKAIDYDRVIEELELLEKINNGEITGPSRDSDTNGE